MCNEKSRAAGDATVSEAAFPTSSSGASHLILLGDSIAAGTGASTPDHGLAPQLAAACRRHGVSVRATVLAVPGSTSRDLPPQVDEAVRLAPDVAVVIIGSNDLIQILPPPECMSILRETAQRLRASGAAVVVVTAPDLSVVPSVPAEYRAVLGEVSAEFAAAQDAAAREAGATVASLRSELGSMFTEDPTLFADDAFHPSDAGYTALAEALQPFVREALAATDPDTDVDD